MFYWDYVLGIVLMWPACALTVRGTGDSGRGFLDAVAQADPASIGLALVLGVLLNCMAAQQGDPIPLFVGVARAVALAGGRAIEETVAFANRAAALSTTRLGTQGAAPRLEGLGFAQPPTADAIEAAGCEKRAGRIPQALDTVGSIPESPVQWSAHHWEPVKRQGGLPPGLMLHPDGTLTGSPGQEGDFEFDLKATDADAGSPETVSQTFRLSVAPPGPGVFRARYVDDRINADGVLDEPCWKLERPVTKRVAGDKTNVQATFDIVHNGGDIYVAVKVVDPDRQLNLEDLPEGDSVEVFVDVLNNREEVYNFDDRRVVVAPTTKHYRPLLVAPLSSGHHGKCVETEDGYTADFWFSTWALGMSNKNFPVVIGLDIAINDDDDGDGRDSQVVWQGSAENDTRPNQFGTVILEPKD